jgi:hypothetical protein
MEMSLLFSVLVLVASAAMLVLMLRLHRRGPFASRACREVHLLAWHLWGGAFLLGFMFAFVIVTSHLNRESLKKERTERVSKDIASLRDRTLTKRQVAGIAQVIYRLQQPTPAERRAENLRNLRSILGCRPSGECQRIIDRIVERTLPRIERTTVVRSHPSQPAEPSRPGPRGPQGLPGMPSSVDLGPVRAELRSLRGAIRDLQSRKTDSPTLNGVDNRLAALEQGLASVLSRLEPLQRLVIALCRVLRPTGPC